MAVLTKTFGDALRVWRKQRRFSQLELATQAEVSARHLSFLETGRAKPSREMVLHLGRNLDLSLRDRNELLELAGFSAAYAEHDMDAPQMDDVRVVLESILDAHNPNPAMILNRAHEIVLANTAALLMVQELVEPDSPALSPTLNAARLLCHPEGIRKTATNWDESVRILMKRMDREYAHRPTDPALGAIMEEVLAYPGVPEMRTEPEVPTGSDLLIPLDFVTHSGQTIKFISTLATIGEPFDVTLEELRLETFFPADTSTKQYLQQRLP